MDVTALTTRLHALADRLEDALRKHTLTVFEYSSNNSGGDWWLSDDDWLSFEKHGAVLEHSVGGRYGVSQDAWSDHPKAGGPFVYVAVPGRDILANPKRRYMGALSHGAYFLAVDDAEAERHFNEHANQNYDDQGCSCCGAPHCITSCTNSILKSLRGEREQDSSTLYEEIAAALLANIERGCFPANLSGGGCFDLALPEGESA